MSGRNYGHVKEKCVGSKKAIFSFICVRKSRTECSMREPIGDWRWGVAIYSVGGSVHFGHTDALKRQVGNPCYEQTEKKSKLERVNS